MNKYQYLQQLLICDIIKLLLDYEVVIYMQNITEIIFGDSLYHELKNSEFTKKNKFIKFEFDMVFELAGLSNIDNNILKLNKDFCNLMSSELNCEIKETISLDNIIKELNESLQNKH